MGVIWHSDAPSGYVYILASRRLGTLYVGVTSNLAARVWQHRNEVTPGFTSRYGVKRLVYAEWHDDIRDAIPGVRRVTSAGCRWR
jgi:putative endonuclease